MPRKNLSVYAFWHTVGAKTIEIFARDVSKTALRIKTFEIQSTNSRAALVRNVDLEQAKPLKKLVKDKSVLRSEE